MKKKKNEEEEKEEKEEGRRHKEEARGRRLWVRLQGGPDYPAVGQLMHRCITIGE